MVGVGVVALRRSTESSLSLVARVSAGGRSPLTPVRDEHRGQKGTPRPEREPWERPDAVQGQEPAIADNNGVMTPRVVALDHVQLAMPAGAEAEAEAFYCGVLGFTVLPKPEPLASRGGRWFAAGDVQVHLGVDADFRAARKAHPALVVAGLDDLVARFGAAGCAWHWDDELPGVRRGYVDDPFGNRIELIDDAHR
jgi:catechol 2,3-dioxygenase-like lactoylglutathione lyase family enzyme